MESSSTSCIGSRKSAMSEVVDGRALNPHFNVLWKAKLPVPTSRSNNPQHMSLWFRLPCKMLTSNECHEENAIMFILEAISNALDAQANEEEVREGVDDLSGVHGGIVILWRADRVIEQPEHVLTGYLPSHQFRVEVTGAQYPSWGWVAG